MILRLFAILFALLTISNAETVKPINCNASSPCVRFCCENCTIEADIRDQPGADSLKTDYVVLRGRACDEMYELDPDEYPDDRWSFLAVRKYIRTFKTIVNKKAQIL